MTDAVHRLLAEALLLSLRERDFLISKLIESIDPGDEALLQEEWDDSWAAEIRRRLDSLESGEAKTIPWEEARESLRSRIGLDEPQTKHATDSESE
jgi:putative addiction module component (TIGR02574 family)